MINNIADVILFTLSLTYTHFITRLLKTKPKNCVLKPADVRMEAALEAVERCGRLEWSTCPLRGATVLLFNAREERTCPNDER